MVDGARLSQPRPMHHMPGMDMSSHEMLMPGMLTAKQMVALRKAKGQEFDQLVFARDDSAPQRRA
jgi:hypothetical protein